MGEPVWIRHDVVLAIHADLFSTSLDIRDLRARRYADREILQICLFERCFPQARPRGPRQRLVDEFLTDSRTFASSGGLAGDA